MSYKRIEFQVGYEKGEWVGSESGLRDQYPNAKILNVEVIEDEEDYGASFGMGY